MFWQALLIACAEMCAPSDLSRQMAQSTGHSVPNQLSVMIHMRAVQQKGANLSNALKERLIFMPKSRVAEQKSGLLSVSSPSRLVSNNTAVTEYFQTKPAFTFQLSFFRECLANQREERSKILSKASRKSLSQTARPPNPFESSLIRDCSVKSRESVNKSVQHKEKLRVTEVVCRSSETVDSLLFKTYYPEDQINEMAINEMALDTSELSKGVFVDTFCASFILSQAMVGKTTTNLSFPHLTLSFDLKKGAVFSDMRHNTEDNGNCCQIELYKSMIISSISHSIVVSRYFYRFPFTENFHFPRKIMYLWS